MDWKNHPLVAASISCASTAVFCITFVMPIYEKKNLNSIDDLETKLSMLSGELDKKTAYTEQLTTEKKKN